MNYSRQREIILNILFNSRSHPTADEVLAEVRKEDQKVARGTVYRNLNQLTECGDVIKFATPEGVYRYDYIHEPHSHAVCKQCGRVFDFTCNECASVTENLKNNIGFTASDVTVTVSGICDQCLKK